MSYSLSQGPKDVLFIVSLFKDDETEVITKFFECENLTDVVDVKAFLAEIYALCGLAIPFNFQPSNLHLNSIFSGLSI